jgi:hypothetical protein
LLSSAILVHSILVILCLFSCCSFFAFKLSIKKQSLIPVFGFSKFDFASPFHPAHTQKLLFLFQYSPSSSIPHPLPLR